MSRDVGQPPPIDFAAAMSERYTQPEPQQPAPKGGRTTSGTESDHTRRSWLLPREVADAFAAAANRIHHASGGTISKSQAQAALMRAGIAAEAVVTRALLSQADDA